MALQSFAPENNNKLCLSWKIILYSLHTDFFCVTQTYFKFKQDWTQNKANHKTNSKQLIFKILFFKGRLIHFFMYTVKPSISKCSQQSDDSESKNSF